MLWGFGHGGGKGDLRGGEMLRERRGEVKRREIGEDLLMCRVCDGRCG